MNKRIVGIETEYGCLLSSDESLGTPESVSAKVKNHVFHGERLGVLDIHYRGWGEPPGNGGFLFNGGRLYIDMGHVEYATPECASISDLIAHDRAGDQILQLALQSLGLENEVSFLKNNIDYHTGATFGCHENYLIRREVPFYKIAIPILIPFFVTRQIFTGAGRIGCCYEYEDQADDSIKFQISQRADHVVTEVYEWVQFSRAIINTRDEPLADHTKYRRLHLLVGDSNMSEYALALKVGTTCLVLDLIEEGRLPRSNISLRDPIKAIKQISRDQNFRWIVDLYNGQKASAIEIQRQYLELAQKHLKNRDYETDWTLSEWESTLDALERNPMSLTSRLDWVAKKWLLEEFVKSENLSWDDPWLKSIDLEYHIIDSNRSLYYDLQSRGLARRVITEEEVESAIFLPPANTRAKARSEIMSYLSKIRIPFVVDWDCIYFANEQSLSLSDPFDTYGLLVEELKKRLRKNPLPKNMRREE